MFIKYHHKYYPSHCCTVQNGRYDLDFVMFKILTFFLILSHQFLYLEMYINIVCSRTIPISPSGEKFLYTYTVLHVE